MQYFERSVMLFNPMYANTDQEVTLLPLGKLEAQQYEFNPVTPFEGTPERWYFPETGFSLSGAFLNFWRNNGDNAALGLPVSEPYLENQPDSTKLEVQYFEFAKLEFHPEAKPDQNVQLALVGAKKAEADLKPAQLAPLLAPKGNESPTFRVPSLMFHYVREVDRKKDLLGFNLSVTPANFGIFLDWIKDNGFNTVTVEQILDHLKYGVELPEKAINLRFDDGHVDMWPVYQELKKREMTATFYVVTRRLELLPEQWRQIDQDGFEVAAHTRTHPDLRGVRDLADEITGSKLDLEAMLGHPVRTFAYPYGKYGPAITKVAQDSGFELAVTTDGGYNWVAGNMLKQPTISVTGNDNLTDFASKILNGMPKGTVLPPLPQPTKPAK
jgi:peptidoglycan/xylan/chitin deacetylase (PgdA/CDA1 family)